MNDAIVTAIIGELAKVHPLIPVGLTILGGLVVLGQVVVLITPGKADDEAFSKLEGIPVVGAVLKALKAFAPIQKK